MAIKSALLAVIVESSDDAIISKTLDGRITSWNAGATRIFGYQASEMIGQSITRLIPPDLHDEEKQILARLRQGERVEHSETVRTQGTAAASTFHSACPAARSITARWLAPRR